MNDSHKQVDTKNTPAPADSFAESIRKCLEKEGIFAVKFPPTKKVNNIHLI